MRISDVINDGGFPEFEEAYSRLAGMTVLDGDYSPRLLPLDQASALAIGLIAVGYGYSIRRVFNRVACLKIDYPEHFKTVFKAPPSISGDYSKLKEWFKWLASNFDHITGLIEGSANEVHTFNGRRRRSREIMAELKKPEHRHVYAVVTDVDWCLWYGFPIQMDKEAIDETTYKRTRSFAGGTLYNPYRDGSVRFVRKNPNYVGPEPRTACKRCMGSGHSLIEMGPGGRDIPCPHCDGTGEAPSFDSLGGLFL